MGRTGDPTEDNPRLKGAHAQDSANPNFAKIQVEHGECQLGRREKFQMSTMAVYPDGLSSRYSVRCAVESLVFFALSRFEPL